MFCLPDTLSKPLKVKDKFETLCHVEADVSAAPYETGFTKRGAKYCKRHVDVILLLGLTELKAQLSWIDSETVRTNIGLLMHIHLT